jgi:competence protein ComEC
MGRIAVAFLLGHCCIHSLAALPSLLPWALLLGALLGLGALIRAPWIVAFCAGVAWAWLNGALRVEEDLPTALEGQALVVSGAIASIPKLGAGQQQFLLDVETAVSGVPPKLLLAWYQADRLVRAGEKWQLVVILKRRNGFANPGGFDYEGHLFREHIGATGYVRDDSRNRRLEPPSAAYVVTRMREAIADRIEQAVGEHRALGLLQGLAVGHADKITDEQWRVFAATGTTHLLAISGLHVSMVAALAAWLGGGIVRLRHAQSRGWTAMHGQVIAGTAAAVLYAMLAGLSIPTQRTLIMLCVYFASRWWRRETDPAHILGVALIAVLLLDPFAPLAIGAWLSFGAVAVILLSFCGRLGREGVVRSFARVQIAVTLGLLPPLLVAFGGISVVSAVANALAAPVFTLLLVPCVLTGSFLAALWLPAGKVVLAISVWIVEGIWPALAGLADLPIAMWYFPALPAPELVSLCLGVLALLLPGVWPVRLCGALLCVPALAYAPPTPLPGRFELSVLDVGQGLSVVLRTHAHVLVYDAGPAFRSGRDAGELVVLPFLRHEGIRRIDRLVIGHGDLDHRGGMHSLLSGLGVRQIVVGPSVLDRPSEATVCRAGERWSWDGVDFAVLHPSRLSSAVDNDSSCVLRIDSPFGSALLTGDIEAPAEAELIARGMEPAEVVVMPHHGSRTSSTIELTAALQAQVAIASAGYRNRWGFPRPEVLERWRRTGARTLATSESGAIRVSFGEGRVVRLSEYRKARARYWRR